MSGLRVACLQMNSSSDVDANLAFIENEIKSATPFDILALPENFAQMPKHRLDLHIESPGQGRVQEFVLQLAERLNIYIVAGSIPINENSNNKPFARCLVVAPNGVIGHYDKLHLFDTEVPGEGSQKARQRYQESDTYQQGSLNSRQLAPTEIKIGSNTVRLGASICYDLRFPELYRELSRQGANVITVPSAFTYDTGKAHWECLLRARAIENQAFVLAPAQVGEHENGRRTWGHSMIIDPWGQVLASKSSGAGLLYADLDLHQIEQLNDVFPVLAHKRLS